MIPVDTLVFPRKGARKIRFHFDAEGTSASAQCTVTHQCTEAGYLEKKDNRKKFEILAVQLAFAVSSADGEVHQKEAHVIREWIRRRVEVAGDEGAAKDRLNTAIRQELQEFRDGKIRDVHGVCQKVLGVTTVADRYDVLELCLKVAQADGVAEEDELDMVNRLAELLDVDQERFRSMRDQHFSAVIENQSGMVDANELLGITPEMSETDVKKHLRKEFQKWNQLATHKDADKREQAKRMLDLIGKKRAEISKQSVNA